MRRPNTGSKPTSLIAEYSAQMGRLVEQRMAMAAMLAAKQDAERQAQMLRAEVNQRVQAQSRLAFLANHDPLTSLGNRVLLGECLDREMERARRSGTQLALFCLDLDHFKDVNDTLGHAAGDALLRDVARRLEACLRDGSMVARMGGDEFAILMPDLRHPDEARTLAERVISALVQPVDLGERRVFVGVSIGVTFFPQDGGQADQLLRNADLALYQTKHNGRNGYYFYDAHLNDEVHRRASLEQSLHEALTLRQFSVAYQPQVDIATNRLTGVEALIRWKHPEHGIVPPHEFVPVAERSGLINTIGAWIMAESCHQVVRWDQAGLPPMRVAVNVATMQFKNGDVPRMVANVLEQTGVLPSRLELEITESGVMHDIRDAVGILTTLHNMGVTLAIDDFGTGYSSLSYLRKLPIDKIKVDRSFVTDVMHNEDAATVARTIVTLGHNLRLKVVAEGVETDAHARYIRQIRCDLGQGYYYGPPSSADRLTKLLGRSNLSAWPDKATVQASEPVPNPPQPSTQTPSGGPVTAHAS